MPVIHHSLYWHMSRHQQPIIIIIIIIIGEVSQRLSCTCLLTTNCVQLSLQPLV